MIANTRDRGLPSWGDARLMVDYVRVYAFHLTLGIRAGGAGDFPDSGPKPYRDGDSKAALQYWAARDRGLPSWGDARLMVDYVRVYAFHLTLGIRAGGAGDFPDSGPKPYRDGDSKAALKYWAARDRGLPSWGDARLMSHLTLGIRAGGAGDFPDSGPKPYRDGDSKAALKYWAARDRGLPSWGDARLVVDYVRVYAFHLTLGIRAGGAGDFPDSGPKPYRDGDSKAALKYWAARDRGLPSWGDARLMVDYVRVYAFHLTLGIRAGGAGDFPDSGPKPYRDGDSKAALQYWAARDRGLPSWGDARLMVDYVRVYAFHLTLGIRAGGAGDFPDSGPKPYRDGDSKAALQYWAARDRGLPSWGDARLMSHLTLGIRAGGAGDFPDSGPKPYRDGDSKAALQYWAARDRGLPSWGDARLMVDYVRVYAV
ncbi:unnamed protein product [Plutella xylostella]|uniref:(diamondback moth) hypothetical protein n=1 Tax=Plutella xylostella TaxID=51655 RepID=A0A8S4D2H5_PLUXY|nr:unnamed protein product [Plutella xylostella]